MTAIRLLLVEVDAALLTPEGRLTARAERAASSLRDAGIALALTSGRPPLGLRALIESLTITTPTSTFDGGRLVRPDLSTIEQHPLDDPVAEAVIPLLERHGADVWVYQDDEWLVRRTSAHVIREQAIMELAPRVVEGWTGVVRGAVKVVAVSDDPEALARSEADLASYCAHVATARSQPGHLDVMHPRANKGEVARSLAKRLGLPIEALATLGGTASDVHMFRESGLAIAMGHACASLQRQAHFISRSSSDEGFACAVESWVLPASRADPA